MPQLEIQVCDATDIELLTEQFAALLRKVVDSPDTELPTALFVVGSDLLNNFEDYMDWADLCDQVLQHFQLEGVIQLATFHPQYVFAGEASEDMSHFTNRSPFPMLHLIREADITHALQSVTRPEAIPERNQRHMRRLGSDGVLQLMPDLAHTAIFRS